MKNIWVRSIVSLLFLIGIFALFVWVVESNSINEILQNENASRTASKILVIDHCKPDTYSSLFQLNVMLLTTFSLFTSAFIFFISLYPSLNKFLQNRLVNLLIIAVLTILIEQFIFNPTLTDLPSIARNICF